MKRGVIYPLARGWGSRPMRLCCFEYERPGRSRVERCLGKHLERDPVQVRFPLPLHGEAALQLFSAHYILEHRIAIIAEAEYDKGLAEDRVLRVERENPQGQIWPVSVLDQTLKLLIHDRLAADQALQDRFIEHDQ